jgi:hypothetical protein
MLRVYALYVYLTKAKPIIRDKPILSSERMLHTDYGRKGSVPPPPQKKPSGRGPQGASSQDELTGYAVPVYH